MSYIKQVWCLVLCIQVFLKLAHSEDDVPEPVGLFPLNSLHTTKDISNSYLTAGTAVGVSLAPGPDGRPDGSYIFPGSATSYIEIPQQTKLDTRYSITVLLWVISDGQDGILLNYEPGAAGQWGLHMFTFGTYRMFFRAMTRNNLATKTAVSFECGTEKKWRYVGYSYDYNTGYQRLFVDGVQVAEGNIGQVELATNYKIILGGVKVGENRAFIGRLSCLQIYDKALTQSQVQAVKDNCMEKNVLGYSACFGPQIINDPTRALDFVTSGQLPDRQAFIRRRWYRLKNKDVGAKIVTSCPAAGSCGAQSPGWLNGQYPTMETGIKKMEICYRSGSDCCANKATVYVRQCYGYPVFKFDDVPDVSRVCTETDPSVFPTVNFQSVKKGCLVGHVMKTESDVIDYSTCITYCLHSSERCQSVNFLSSNGTCQFNNATLTDYPLHVTVDSGCIYYQRTAVMSYIIP